MNSTGLLNPDRTITPYGNTGGGSGGDDKNFVGTTAEWEAMTTAEQNEYDTMDFTDENEDPADAASKSDISSLKLIGTVNPTDNTITSGTWFYLNGKIVKAKTDIASGATFTKDTNYEEKTIGEELSELNSKFVHIPNPALTFGSNIDSSSEIDIIIIGQVAFVTFNIYTISAESVNSSLDIGEENLPQHRYSCGSALRGSDGVVIPMYSSVNHHLYIPLEQGCRASEGFYGSITIPLIW